MALDGNRLGTAIHATVIAARPAAGALITDAELLAMWKLIGIDIVDEIKNNAVTSTTGVTATGPAGGPLPITAQPGTVS